MNKKCAAVYYTLFSLLLFFPISTILAGCLDYCLFLFHATAFAIVLAAFSISSAVFLLSHNSFSPSKAMRFLLWSLPMLSLINWLLYLQQGVSLLSFICLLICFISTLIISISFSKPLILKTLGIILSILVIPLVLFVSLFSSLGKNTVVAKIPSPNEQYYAEVVDSDQGALGGNTIVYVYENRGFDVLIFSVKPTPDTIYVGEWHEYEGMSIYWESDTSLIIYDKTYYIE